MPAQSAHVHEEPEPQANDVEALLDEALDHIVGGMGDLLPADDEKALAQDVSADKPLRFI